MLCFEVHKKFFWSLQDSQATQHQNEQIRQDQTVETGTVLAKSTRFSSHSNKKIVVEH